MSGTYKKMITKGYESAIGNTPIENDTLRITIDTGQLYADLNNERIEISDFVKGMTEEEIRSIFAPLPKIYFSSDTCKFLIYNAEAGEWIVCAERNEETVPKALYADNAKFATNATKATEDNSGNNINDTYVMGATAYKNVITFTRGNGSKFHAEILEPDFEFGDLDEVEPGGEEPIELDYEFGDLDEEPEVEPEEGDLVE